MKITVRKIDASDIPVRVSWINDIRVHGNMHFDVPVSIINTEFWFESISNSNNRFDLIFIDAQDGPLGMSGLTNIELDHQSAEFYIFINPEFHGRGIGKMITQWTVNFGFLKYNLNKIYLYTDSDNTIALSLYENLGFVKEGVQRKHRFKLGSFKDKVAFGILREEWIEKDWAENEIKLAFSR